jgi:hypothetical protein
MAPTHAAFSRDISTPSFDSGMSMKKVLKRIGVAINRIVQSGTEMGIVAYIDNQKNKNQKKQKQKTKKMARLADCAIAKNNFARRVR